MRSTLRLSRSHRKPQHGARPFSRYFLAALAVVFLPQFDANAQSEEGAGGPPQMPPAEVSFVVAKRETIPVKLLAVGVTEASRVTEVRARVQGIVEKRMFEEGGEVNEGDPLYLIDPRSFQADVDIAKARTAQAESRASFTNREHQRMQTLGKTGAMSEGDLDRALADADESAAALLLAKAELAKAELELSYTDVRAPISGIIGKAQRDVGSLVDDGENSLLTKITRISPLYINISVGEREYLQWMREIKAGELVVPEGVEQSFELVLQDGTVFNEPALIKYTEVGIDSSTGSVSIRAEIPNAKGDIRPGQFLSGRMIGWQRPNTIAVPRRCVNQAPTGPFVYVIDDQNTIQFRPVVVGDWVDDRWIVTSGLEDGERVLVEGFLKTMPGAVVNPVPHVEPKPGAADSQPADGSHSS